MKYAQTTLIHSSSWGRFSSVKPMCRCRLLTVQSDPMQSSPGSLLLSLYHANLLLFLKHKHMKPTPSTVLGCSPPPMLGQSFLPDITSVSTLLTSQKAFDQRPSYASVTIGILFSFQPSQLLQVPHCLLLLLIQLQTVSPPASPLAPNT